MQSRYNLQVSSCVMSTNTPRAHLTSVTATGPVRRSRNRRYHIRQNHMLPSATEEVGQVVSLEILQLTGGHMMSSDVHRPVSRHSLRKSSTDIESLTGQTQKQPKRLSERQSCMLQVVDPRIQE